MEDTKGFQDSRVLWRQEEIVKPGYQGQLSPLKAQQRTG